MIILILLYYLYSCKQPYYVRAEVTTNNDKLAQSLTKARRNTILALGRTDNTNAQFYDLTT